jgi:hypothetical protein
MLRALFVSSIYRAELYCMIFITLLVVQMPARPFPAQSNGDSHSTRSERFDALLRGSSPGVEENVKVRLVIAIPTTPHPERPLYGTRLLLALQAAAQAEALSDVSLHFVLQYAGAVPPAVAAALVHMDNLSLYGLQPGEAPAWHEKRVAAIADDLEAQQAARAPEDKRSEERLERARWRMRLNYDSVALLERSEVALDQMAFRSNAASTPDANITSPNILEAILYLQDDVRPSSHLALNNCFFFSLVMSIRAYFIHGAGGAYACPDKACVLSIGSLLHEQVRARCYTTLATMLQPKAFKDFSGAGAQALVFSRHGSLRARENIPSLTAERGDGFDTQLNVLCKMPGQPPLLHAAVLALSMTEHVGRRSSLSNDKKKTALFSRLGLPVTDITTRTGKPFEQFPSQLMTRSLRQGRSGHGCFFAHNQLVIVGGRAPTTGGSTATLQPDADHGETPSSSMEVLDLLFPHSLQKPLRVGMGSGRGVGRVVFVPVAAGQRTSPTGLNPVGSDGFAARSTLKSYSHALLAGPAELWAPCGEDPGGTPFSHVLILRQKSLGWVNAAVSEGPKVPLRRRMCSAAALSATTPFTPSSVVSDEVAGSDSLICAFGGVDENDVPLRSISCFDRLSETWLDAPSLPTPVVGGVAVVLPSASCGAAPARIVLLHFSTAFGGAPSPTVLSLDLPLLSNNSTTEIVGPWGDASWESWTPSGSTTTDGDSGILDAGAVRSPVRGEILSAGGRYGPGKPALNRIETLNVCTRKWRSLRPKTALASPRAGAPLCSDGAAAIMCGGDNALDGSCLVLDLLNLTN